MYIPTDNTIFVDLPLFFLAATRRRKMSWLPESQVNVEAEFGVTKAKGANQLTLCPP